MNYLVSFGSSTISGLAPTFSVFKAMPGGGATTAPAITEIASSSGLYTFSYVPAGPVAFVIDGFTTGLPGLMRYVIGQLTPLDNLDTGITALAAGISSIQSGFGASLTTLLGTTASSFGSTSADPATVFGYLKRLVEFGEGNSIFTKTSGTWDVYARGNAVGASTQLIQKTVTDSGSVITKS